MKIKSIPLLFRSLLIILLFTTACSGADRKNQEQVSAATDEKELKGPNTAELHEKLMRSFSEDWMERESDPDLYPAYYGGSYTDYNGTFVVAVTGNPEANKERLAEILGTPDFNVIMVQYPYRQLMLVMDRINDFIVNPSIPEDHPVMMRFAGAYPDVKDNRVKVVLTAVSVEAIDAFKRDISNSPTIVFEQGEIPQQF